MTDNDSETDLNACLYQIFCRHSTGRITSSFWLIKTSSALAWKTLILGTPVPGRLGLFLHGLFHVMTNLFYYQELLFLSFAIKGVEIQRSKVTFWSFQNHRHILTLVKRELRLRRRASSLILYLTLGRCWDKHVSCGNQTVFTKTWLRTWVLQSVWMQEEYNFYTTVWWQQTILQTPEIPVTEHQGRTFWATGENWLMTCKILPKQLTYTVQSCSALHSNYLRNSVECLSLGEKNTLAKCFLFMWSFLFPS